VTEKDGLSPNQTWRLILNPDRTYSIASPERDGCLTVGSERFEDGIAVSYERCNGSVPQRWWVESANSNGFVYTGISVDTFPFSRANYLNYAWSWSASVQILLKYYGVEQSQTNINQRTFALDNTSDVLKQAEQLSIDDRRGWGFAALTTRLNEWDVGTDGSPNLIKAELFDKSVLTPSQLIGFLNKSRPIMAVRYFDDGVVLIIGATYANTVRTIIVQDPIEGPREYPAKAFLESIKIYWEVELLGSRSYRHLERSLSTILDEASAQFRLDISKVPSYQVRAPNGRSTTVYTVLLLKVFY
jgi:hypothetical protein